MKIILLALSTLFTLPIFAAEDIGHLPHTTECEKKKPRDLISKVQTYFQCTQKDNPSVSFNMRSECTVVEEGYSYRHALKGIRATMQINRHNFKKRLDDWRLASPGRILC